MPEKKNFVLRLNQATYKALEKWAADEFRSVNGQIEFILHDALKEQFGHNYRESFRKPEGVKHSSPTATKSHAMGQVADKTHPPKDAEQS